MKKLFLIQLFAYSFPIFAQVNTIPAGEYKSKPGEREKINLVLSENNKFNIAIFSGTYEQSNDSIIFHNDNENTSNFNLEYSNLDPKAKKITLNFDGISLYYYSDNKYIGIQEKENSEIIYKTFKEFTHYDAMDYNEKIKYNIEIDRAYAIFFVTEIENNSFIEKFILPKNISEIKVIQNSERSKNINLNGFYNQKTKVLTIGEKGRNMVEFSIQNNENKDDLPTKPSESNLIKDWTYSGKLPKEDLYNQVVDTTATVDYSRTVEVATAYTFKLKTEKTLKDAFQSFEKNKNKSRFLIIINDLNNKNIETEFKDYITNYETNLAYTMYDGYNPEYDHFDFYMTNSKDKSEMKKKGITLNPSVTFFDSDLSKLYFSNQKIMDDLYSYYNLSTINTDLKILSSNAKFDVLFANKNATLEQSILALHEISKLEIPYNYEDTTDLPVISTIQETQFVPPIVVKEEIKEVETQVEVSKTEVVEDVKTDVTETVAVDANYNYDYSILKIKENKYKFKTPEKKISEKWIKILESNLAVKNVNKKLAITILKELSNKGFNKILFKNNEVINSKKHNLEMDYILKHYDTISKFNNTLEESIYDSDYYSVYDLKDTYLNLINQSVQKGNYKTKEELNRGMSRYKSFTVLTNNDAFVMSSYMEALKANLVLEEYLSTYEIYFNSVIKNKSSIIEQLDEAFAIKQKEDYSANWVEYKYNFANQANNAAWFVVENIKDADAIKKAIVWSETSLVIQKNDQFYLDTLAQLYYKNGEKEKAILTEQKAIDVLTEDDFSQRQEYEKVLEKMKNGTY